MKTNKLILITVSWLTLSALWAEKPQNLLPKDLSNNLLDKVCRYVEVTNEQKQSIKSSANDYENTMIAVINDKTINNKNTVLDSALMVYRSKVDSILTQEQKDTMIVAKSRELKIQTENFLNNK